MAKIQRILLVLTTIVLFVHSSNAEDSDDFVFEPNAADTLESTTKGTLESSPYLSKKIEDEYADDNAKISSKENLYFNENLGDLSVQENSKSKFTDIGYTAPGTFESQGNYNEIDKKTMMKEVRSHSSGSINLTFIKNDFNYESQNDVINKTISEGPKHVKGGVFYIRNDKYFKRTDFFNSFWSFGGGLGYNRGRGLFVTGEKSDTIFRLWEIPLDFGVGIELTVANWFKFSGAAGPSILVLFQNRDDYGPGEKGRNKSQWSYGQFVNAQFKVSLAGLNAERAYELYTESAITNLYVNFELRYQNYQNFQDPIKVSGTSFGIGFTFEYL